MEGPPADERLRWRRGDDGCLCSLETEADDEAVAVAALTLSPASKEPDLGLADSISGTRGAARTPRTGKEIRVRGERNRRWSCATWRN